MKNILKKFLIICAVITATSATFSFTTPQSASADCRYFLGMTSWDCNTGFGPNTQPNESTIKTGIWTIVANIVTDITVATAYLVIGFVIYGGYRYIFSGGDPAKVAAGKKTLTQAFLGLAIVLSANIIMGSIRIALVANGNIGSCDLTVNDPSSSCVNMDNAGDMVTRLINWVTGVAGVVSAIFVVYGGIAYITSAGDPGKVEKAKKTILYSLIGLIIVALVITITGFVSSTVRKATSQVNDTTTIVKEVYEKTHIT